jgi:23S rRNA (guanosine2251-2'-O)-methyltransferase
MPAAMKPSRHGPSARNRRRFPDKSRPAVPGRHRAPAADEDGRKADRRFPSRDERRGEADAQTSPGGRRFARSQRGSKGGPPWKNREPQPRRQDARGRDDRAGDDRKPRRRAPHGAAPSSLWIYGRHAAIAAILNERRAIRRILATETALEWIADAKPGPDRAALIQPRAMRDIDEVLHEGAVHQGIAAEVEDLPRARLKDACRIDARRRPIVVLDQITDPHNIGAIFRSAAAFGAAAIIVQDRRTPPLAGALAKAAAGAVELVPAVAVVNIARAIEGLKALGYACVGLSGESPRAITEIDAAAPAALVLGAEGAGLRRLVRESCDALVRIPIDPKMESLNVSTACAVALYELTQRGGRCKGDI